VYLARSEYDPQAIIKVIGVLKNQEMQDEQLAKQEGREPRRYHGLFATHPDNDTRLQQAVGEAGKQTVAHPVAGRSEFLAAIEGLVFNDNSDQGVVRNNRFYHGELGMTLQFPESWQVHNQPDVLAAVSPQGEAQIVMKAGGKANGTPVEFARRIAGYNAQIQALEVNGLPAALIDLPDSVGGVVFLDKQAFILQGKTKNKPQLPAYRERIVATLKSFRALTAEERKQIKPLTIHVIPVWAGDSYAKLSRNSPLGQSAESYLRLINAQYPNGEPQVGQHIKVVE
jgi:predicted Zn-dependent protease